MKLNEVFLERMKCMLKEDFDKFLSSFEHPITKSIYVNENKISLDQFRKIIDFHIEQIPYEKAGFYVDNEKKGRHPLHHAGAFYMQEPSAMFTINSIRFNGDERVLDLCAAPGGKTIQIANRIPNGVLVSNEINKSRSEILYSNIERMGLKNVIVANDTPQNIADAYGDSFDVCVVDAPCSGEGMFRRGEEVSAQWNENLDAMCAERQLEILEQANKTLKTGGKLIYSTCTYSKKENEDVVRNFMEKHDYKLCRISYPHSRGINMSEAVRLYPHENKGEGQFVAVLIKHETNNESCYSSQKLTNSKLTNDFIKTYTNLNSECVEYKNTSYLPACKDLVKKHVNYVSIGVRLGKVESNRFEPHHNLFSALAKTFKLQLIFDYRDDKVAKYLRGETFDVDLSDGYGVVVVNGCGLGGFKVSQGRLKNYYPKGLRNF